MRGKCIYYVEGSCEEKLINALKQEPRFLIPGRVKILNVVSKEITKSELVGISQGTKVVFVFDTDVNETKHLENNIQLIKKYCRNVSIVYLAQVLNLEDELVRATDVKDICELTRSKSRKDFKSDFVALSDCRSTLERHHFDINSMWNSKKPDSFAFVEDNSNDVKYS